MQPDKLAALNEMKRKCSEEILAAKLCKAQGGDCREANNLVWMCAAAYHCPGEMNQVWRYCRQSDQQHDDLRASCELANANLSKCSRASRLPSRGNG